MKNICFVLFYPLFFISGTSAQTNIGFKAGYNYSTAKISINKVDQDNHFKSGYGFGIIFKAPFDGVLHFSPYVVYNKRGYKYSPSTGTIKEIENTIHYIDIAPCVSFDFPVQSKNPFIIGFGPVLGIAISGKEKSRLTNGSLATKKMKFNFYNYGTIDMGFNGSIGFKYKKFLVESSLLYGVADIENNDLKKRNINNRTLSLSIGYYFK